MLTTFNIIVCIILAIIFLGWLLVIFLKFIHNTKIWITIPNQGVICVPGLNFDTGETQSIVTAFKDDKSSIRIYDHNLIYLDFEGREGSKPLTVSEIEKLVNESDAGLQSTYFAFRDLYNYSLKNEKSGFIKYMTDGAKSFDLTGNFIITIAYRNNRFQKQKITIVQSVTKRIYDREN